MKNKIITINEGTYIKGNVNPPPATTDTRPAPPGAQAPLPQQNSPQATLPQQNPSRTSTRE
ncbi:MAG: hypothetical protein JRJ49_10720 [Deltaproteobacteria bacterium]|nr:hypothetical protein [Deltaproteobacteria bacterium]